MAILVDMAMHSQTWPYMAIYGHAWPNMAIYDHIWPCMDMHGQTWPYMALHGHKRPDMAIYGHAWPHTAMIYGTSWMRSNFRSAFRCAKLQENPENLGFTFFGFLRPYLGVSGSLVYFKRRGLKRSIVWYKNFLISCLVAWYSAVFVVTIHGNPWKSLEIYGSRRWYGSMF